MFAKLIEKRQTALFSGVWREIRKKIHQKLAEKMQNSTKKLKKIGNSVFQLFNREKSLAIFDEKIEIRERFFASGFQNGAKKCIV